ncbi:stage II sporulation protein R [Brevibacillus dissolubilis]|uniref:stage II sporulation protein R n=1 Tax=Brevibacillus dissolubilis TaxID=1844116 RepID=UPI0011174C24|nr:stage II sporulation protein R [Brevibacillus dissolubilis]
MKRFFFILFALTVALMSWEGQKSSANVIDNGPIPTESIRLRILANSDSMQDQWLKREVRDAIIANMNNWVTDIQSFDEAREVVKNRLPELQEIVEETIRDRGFSYEATVDFGAVPFPTKLYGSYVYPAGEYEALRVRIGEAKGQNWWCVLFPPLCFIDMSNGDAVQAKEPTKTVDNAEGNVEKSEFYTDNSRESEEQATAQATETAEVAPTEDSQAEAVESNAVEVNESVETAVETVKTEADDMQADEYILDNNTQNPEVTVDNQNTVEVQAPEVEVRFFLWEKLKNLF